MTTPKQFGERVVRRRADAREVTIVSRNDDGTYEADDTRTGQRLRCSPSNPRDSFSPGQRVMVATPDASLNILGGGYVIIATSPEEARAVSRTTRRAGIRRASPLITGIEPYPVRLEIGSATPQEQLVRGFNLADTPTYEVADITDDSPPVVSIIGVTSQLVALTGVVGEYDLEIHGRTFENAVELYEAVVVGSIVYLSVYNAVTSEWWMASFDVDNQNFVRLLDSVPAGFGGGSGMVLNGANVTGLFLDNATGLHLLTIQTDVGSIVVDDSGLIADDGAGHNFGRSLAWNGTQFVLATTGTTAALYTINADGSSQTQIADLAAVGITSYVSVGYGLTYYWLSGIFGMKRISGVGAVTSVDLSGLVIGAFPQVFAFDATYVYAVLQDTLARWVPSTLVRSTIALSSNNTPDMLIVGGYIYIAGSTKVIKVEIASFTEVDILVVNAHRLAATGDGGTLYALYGASVVAIDLATFTVTKTSTLPADFAAYAIAAE